jgi:hypothetical protein
MKGSFSESVIEKRIAEERAKKKAEDVSARVALTPLTGLYDRHQAKLNQFRERRK